MGTTRLRANLRRCTAVALAMTALLPMAGVTADTPGLSDVVIFTGVTGSVACGAISAPVSQNVTPGCLLPGGGSASGGIPFVGGTGNYTFGNSSIDPLRVTPSCLIASDVDPGSGEPTPGEVTAPACALGSTGVYINIVCGTGLAFGQGWVSSTESSIVVNPYLIVFIAGLGILTSTSVTEEGSSELAAAGLVQLIPALPLPSAPTCLSAFDATGIVTIVDG